MEKQDIIQFISTRLKNRKLKYEIHHFDSGAVMIDIWKDDSFYVIQIEGQRIGLSQVTEDTPIFETDPDRWYDDFEQFSKDFQIMTGD